MAVATATSSTIELRHQGDSTPTSLQCNDRQATPPPEEDGLDVDGRQEFSLPPVDGGKDAWFFLAACFFVEALTWGFPFSFGVFQDYYSTHEPFAGSEQIPIIGTCAMGIMYLDIPLVMGIQRMYPWFSRWSPMLGLVLMCVSLAASSFSQNVGHLIVTQGVFYAIGGSISYCPCLLYMDEWFARRKGLAYGIMWSGTGLAGFSLPLILEVFLHKYGFRTTLRIWAVALLVLTMPLAFFIKPRLPRAATTHIKPFKLGFALTKTFMLHQIANTVQGLGFFLPGIYLPTYARSIGASSFTSALTLLLVNVASTVGCAVMGSLTDHLHVTTCLMISAAGAGLGTFLLWGFATSIPVLFVFCIIYGLFAGPYTSAWTGIMKDVATEMGTYRGTSGGSSFDPTMVIGVLSTGRGIGNIVSGPLSQVLVKGMPWKGEALGGYGTGYGPLIAFTGVTAVMSGATFVWHRVGWM
ncbi:MFS transporter [Metarhizium robertsii]|uniref:Major facilitator superfamily domain protein n=2 Tax=Metarhizium robertsii TaxID=568076 RepID=E9FDL2_METRA|nr:Major facilitator superfamily domain protein [Metarhizium robertsii ARSEF 23]EFY94170.1 Major facilitator superfamily domain protein [Metarhizium robertsii ARSEF 23]EXU95491.1 MFS transporter [Metarhizium robertsii]